MTKGTIYHINAPRGMYSVKLENGTFTVFELVDPKELPQSAEVTGLLERYGEREIVMDGECLHVHIDNYGLNEQAAFNKTFLMA